MMLNNDHHNEEKEPHSPCVLMRETAEGGLTRGWGNHFKTAELYFADAHIHLDVRNMNNMTKYFDEYYEKLRLKRIRHMGVILPITLENPDPYRPDLSEVGCIENLNRHFELLAKRDDVSLMVWPHYSYPNLDFIKKAWEKGAKGVKLHNYNIMMENIEPEIWLSEDWNIVFKYIEEKKMPVLFHVTQRMTPNLYGLGGSFTYWKEGVAKGVKFGNAELIDVYLEIVEKYPEIPFVTAHQMHVGWEKLSKLFDKYPNFYVDTSVGCTVLEYDRMYDSDREYLREIFIKYNDRILFGTDTFIEDRSAAPENSPTEYDHHWIGMHIRYIKELNLPYDVLQNISHRNFERLYGLEEKDVGVR